MAHQPYRPEPVPLQFVASSFSADAAQAVPGAPVAGGSFAAAYPPPAFNSGGGGGGGGGSFGLPQTSYGAAAGGFAGPAPSFEDEPPLLEGALAQPPRHAPYVACVRCLRAW